MNENILVTQSLGGPAVVLSLVLAETAFGGIAVLWLTPAWGKVRTGFYKLVGAVLATCAVLAWLAGREEFARAGGSAGTGGTLMAVAAGLAVLWQVLLWARALQASRVVSIASAVAGLGALVAVGAHPDAANAAPIAAFQLLAGALFAGAVTDGLLLGHWHLVDRKLGREPITRMNQLFLAGCVVSAIGAAFAGSGGGEARTDLSPLLGAGALAVYIAIGLAALCGLIGFFIRALIRENSIQAATGLFYLGVIMTLAAEFAAKVRFF